MKKALFFLSLVVLFGASFNKILAHGPVHEAIIQLTKEIESAPDSIFLYFERGALYKIDEDYDKAIADFEQVLSRDYSIHTAYFQLADIYFKKEYFLECKYHVDHYLTLAPNAASAYQLRGTLYKLQGEIDLAIADFQKVIALRGNRIVPGEVLQLSQLLNIHHPSRAIQILEYGLDRLPANISLESSLIDLTISIGDYEKAMNHINQILSTTPRKEFWLLKKAAVFEAMGDCEQAKTTYHHSLSEIASLKRKSKQTQFVKNIQAQALFALQYL